MATAFFGPAKQKAPVESSGSVPHVGLAGQSPLPFPGHAYLSAYGVLTPGRSKSRIRPERAVDVRSKTSFSTSRLTTILPPLQGGLAMLTRAQGLKPLAQSYYAFGISLTRPFGSKASRSGNGNRTVPDPVYIGKEVTMQLPNPINSTNRTNKSTNHLFYSMLVSGFLTLVTCTMLTPKTQHHAANYVEPRHQATNQTTKDIDPGYDWFY